MTWGTLLGLIMASLPVIAAVVKIAVGITSFYRSVKGKDGESVLDVVKEIRQKQEAQDRRVEKIESTLSDTREKLRNLTVRHEKLPCLDLRQTASGRRG